MCRDTGCCRDLDKLSWNGCVSGPNADKMQLRSNQNWPFIGRRAGEAKGVHRKTSFQGTLATLKPGDKNETQIHNRGSFGLRQFGPVRRRDNDPTLVLRCSCPEPTAERSLVDNNQNREDTNQAPKAPERQGPHTVVLSCLSPSVCLSCQGLGGPSVKAPNSLDETWSINMSSSGGNVCKQQPKLSVCCCQMSTTAQGQEVAPPDVRHIQHRHLNTHTRCYSRQSDACEAHTHTHTLWRTGEQQ